MTISDDQVSNNVLVDISDWRLERILTPLLGSEDANAVRTALDKIIAAPSNCANSFQSSI